MRTYWNTNRGLRTLEKWEPNCWVQVTCPTQDDIDYLENTLHIPDYFLMDIADTDERARYEFDDGWILIILRIPYVKEVRSRTPYTTIPLGIILNKEVCITVCNFETNMMIDFVSYQQKRGLGFTDSVDMVFRLFLSSAVWYLKRLKQINLLIEKAKQHLDRNVDNVDLINLSRLQDSLTYFITSIRGNETLLSKLKFKLPVDELDADRRDALLGRLTRESSEELRSLLWSWFNYVDRFNKWVYVLFPWDLIGKEIPLVTGKDISEKDLALCEEAGLF